MTSNSRYERCKSAVVSAADYSYWFAERSEHFRKGYFRIVLCKCRHMGKLCVSEIIDVSTFCRKEQPLINNFCLDTLWPTLCRIVVLC